MERVVAGVGVRKYQIYHPCRKRSSDRINKHDFPWVAAIYGRVRGERREHLPATSAYLQVSTVAHDQADLKMEDIWYLSWMHLCLPWS